MSPTDTPISPVPTPLQFLDTEPPKDPTVIYVGEPKVKPLDEEPAKSPTDSPDPSVQDSSQFLGLEPPKAPTVIYVGKSTAKPFDAEPPTGPPMLAPGGDRSDNSSDEIVTIEDAEEVETKTLGLKLEVLGLSPDPLRYLEFERAPTTAIFVGEPRARPLEDAEPTVSGSVSESSEPTMSEPVPESLETAESPRAPENTGPPPETQDSTFLQFPAATSSAPDSGTPESIVLTASAGESTTTLLGRACHALVHKLGGHRWPPATRSALLWGLAGAATATAVWVPLLAYLSARQAASPTGHGVVIAPHGEYWYAVRRVSPWSAFYEGYVDFPGDPVDG